MVEISQKFIVFSECMNFIEKKIGAYSFGIYIKFEYQNPLFFYLFDSVDVKSYPERLEKSHLNLSENDFCCLGTLISKIITNF